MGNRSSDRARRYLTEEVFKRPVFVTDYPKEIKAFYMKLNDDGKTVAAVDCLVPGIGEIIGGSQREDDYDKLKARMDELGLKRKKTTSSTWIFVNMVLQDMPDSDLDSRDASCI